MFELRQPTADSGYPVIPVKVHVARQGSHVRGLASHEPVHWTVTAAPGVVLEAVVLNGHYPQTADVPAGVLLDSLDVTVQGNATDVCDPGWNLATDGACIDGPFVKSLQQRFGRLFSTVSGCDVCNDLALHDDLSPSLLGPVNIGSAWGCQDDTCL